MIGRGTYRQTATYWAAGALDGFGSRTFSAPVTISVRWEDKTDLNVGTVQEFKPSRARVFLQQAVTLGGYLALGDLTSTADPLAVSTAYRIEKYEESPGLSGVIELRKALL